MKKVLILAYDFPPFVSVGGLRPHNWFKYFKEFDIEPIVVTRQWEEYFINEMDYIKPSRSKSTVIEENGFGTIIKASYSPNFPNRLYLKYGENRFRFVRKTCSLFFEIAQYYWNTGPKKSIYGAADKFLQTNNVDVIIATGDPFVLFHYASKLSEKHATPWIADYRDPWSFGLGMEKKTIYKKWNRYIERKTLANVAFVTTVTNIFISKIQLLTEKQIHLIPNGYDPEVIEELVLQNSSNDILTIGFIGSIYEWNPIELFLKVLSQFVSKNGTDSIRLNLYGINNHVYIQELIDKDFPNLKSVVNIYSRLPYNEVIVESSKSNVLLLFNYYAIIGTKIYDYIGMKIPILFCFTNEPEADKLRDKHKGMNDYRDLPFDVQEQLISSKNAGLIVKNANHLHTVIDQLFVEFQETKEIKCITKESFEYSRRNQTGKLVQLINKIIIP